ncbi:hypothetical protein N752_25185 [Desulforamulus aquiferis]|nr:hypothetical protein [Desulforamulus aquiferis]RYD02625.1 hypothetical protein N752_25185 [Desulforamulus aquiferis]
MRIIKSLQDITILKTTNALPPEYLELLEKEFLQMVELLGGLGDYNPNTYGYMVVLESGDNIRDLSVIGLNPEDQGLLGIYPEFIDVFNLTGYSVYKLLVIYSNDYAMTFFSIANQFDEAAEEWIRTNLSQDV